MVFNDIILYYDYTVLIILSVFLIVSIRNIIAFSRLKPIKQSDFNSLLQDQHRTTSPFVSVMVPARNEERLIRECVESLLQQNYGNYEVIVLNDNSSDNTASILNELFVKYPSKLTVIDNNFLPEGWVGKNWACHRLSQMAKGEMLLFTDADTIHKPNCLISSVSFLLKNRLDFFSIIPYEEMLTFGEKTIIPIIHFLFFAYLPNDLITKTKRTSVSAANGQFMFFRKSAYNEINGHQSVKNNLVEDVFLAKEIKKAGKRMALADGTEFVTCRMYTNFSEAFRGFSKNLFAGFSFDLLMFLVFIVHLPIVYIIPQLLPVLYIFLPESNFFSMVEIPLILTAIPIIIRIIMSFRFRLSFSAAFLHSLTALFTMAISINSILWAYSKKGVQWKDRAYKINQAD